MSQVVVPFKIKNVFEGFAESNGLLIADKSELKIQFQTKDSLFGVIKGNVNEIVISLDQIDEITFKKSLFGSKLTISVADMKLLKGIPGLDSGVITVSIENSNVKKALEFVSCVSFDSESLKYRNEINRELNDR